MQYKPITPAQPLTGEKKPKLFLRIEDRWFKSYEDDTRGRFSLVKLKRPIDKVFQGAIESELARLNIPIVSSEVNADAILVGQPLNLVCYSVSGNTDFTFRLYLEDKERRRLWERKIRGTAGAGLSPDCQKDGNEAMAHAIGQIGPFFKGDDVVAKIISISQSSDGQGEGIAFPMGIGKKVPSLYILPVEDNIGPVRVTVTPNNYECSPIAPTASVPFHKALISELDRLGIPIVTEKRKADWILRTVLKHAWIEEKLKTFPNAEARAIAVYNLTLTDKTGEKLYEGSVIGIAVEDFFVNLNYAGKKAVEKAAAHAASKIGPILSGEKIDDIAPIMAAETTAPGLPKVSKELKSASEAMGIIGALIPGGSNIKEVLDKTKDITDKATNVAGMVETADSLRQALTSGAVSDCYSLEHQP